jgi:hypothetical protein
MGLIERGVEEALERDRKAQEEAEWSRRNLRQTLASGYNRIMRLKYPNEDGEDRADGADRDDT